MDQNQCGDNQNGTPTLHTHTHTHTHTFSSTEKPTDLEPEPKIQQQKTKTNRIKWSETIAHKMSHTNPKLFWSLFLDPIGYEEAMFQKKHKFFGAKRTQTRQD